MTAHGNAMHSLLIQPQALTQQHCFRYPKKPADMFGRDLPKASPQPDILGSDKLDGMTLGAAVIANHLARESLRYPELGAQGGKNPAA